MLSEYHAGTSYLSLIHISFNINGSFISAYIFFGAIQEELIRCGKKRWVQLLTLSIMMLPASMMSVTPRGDINVDLTVRGFITLCYCSWIYGKTRKMCIRDRGVRNPVASIVK